MSLRLLQALPTSGFALALALLAAACAQESDKGAQGAGADTLAPYDSAKLDSLSNRRRAYELERAAACRRVYDREHTKYSNVVGWKYDGEVDGCWVMYGYEPPKNAAQCDSMFPPGESAFMVDRLLCHEGRYRTRF